MRLVYAIVSPTVTCDEKRLTSMNIVSRFTTINKKQNKKLLKKLNNKTTKQITKKKQNKQNGCWLCCTAKKNRET